MRKKIPLQPGAKVLHRLLEHCNINNMNLRFGLLDYSFLKISIFDIRAAVCRSLLLDYE